MKRTNSLKKASFTVEAAVIVPIVATMIALLLGFIFFLYENSISTALCYEAEFYAAQITVNDSEDAGQERLLRRIEEKKNESTLGFGQYSYAASAGSSVYTVSVTGEILPAVFQGLFKRNKNISISHMEPVSVKRLMWAGEKLIGD